MKAKMTSNFTTHWIIMVIRLYSISNRSKLIYLETQIKIVMKFMLNFWSSVVTVCTTLCNVKKRYIFTTEYVPYDLSERLATVSIYSIHRMIFQIKRHSTPFEEATEFFNVIS